MFVLDICSAKLMNLNYVTLMGEAYHYKNFYIFDALSFLLGSNIFLRCVFVKVAF